jgi:hypothetical protein
MSKYWFIIRELKEWRIYKYLRRKHTWFIFRYYTGIQMEGFRKTMKILCQNLHIKIWINITFIMKALLCICSPHQNWNVLSVTMLFDSFQICIHLIQLGERELGWTGSAKELKQSERCPCSFVYHTIMKREWKQYVLNFDTNWRWVLWLWKEPLLPLG